MHIANHFVEPGRRERKRLQLLDFLADTAWTLFESEGFAAVTMERIADAADVAKGTLYKHFPAKEALLRHRFHRELEKAWPQVLADIVALPNFEGQLRAFLERSAAWSQSHRAYLLPYVQFRLSEPRRLDAGSRSGLDRIFCHFIAQGQASGEFCAVREPDVLAVYLEFLYLAALLRWLLHEDLSLTEEFSRMLDLFLFGLRPRS
ncbi:TetR/AcrR family transcriptional regulator [Nitrosospira sp. NpAV]|uniref:TetR/AcrR family transcriptional regulator n=1 Tax=Nitrosospira sp. NpAV TaxID=58133 RepID=UPI0005A1AE52|nr:TetR/AcrR family transcriptional regulator [Nitrosospira sp. NpAV]KIO48448.1 TetR family transcriptional regulator [Nitrosospira sp. NpAV]